MIFAPVSSSRQVADANAGGGVQSAQRDGSEAPAPGLATQLGQQVQKGQVLAYLRTRCPMRFERGNQLADLAAQQIALRSRGRYAQLEGQRAAVGN